MQNDRKLIIAIDGYASSGKSTLAKALADVLGYVFIDTGAMYRAATWQILALGIDPSDSRAVAKAAERLVIISGTDPVSPTISVDGTDVIYVKEIWANTRATN